MEEEGKKRKVTFCGATLDTDMAVPSGTASPATSQPSTSWQLPYDHATIPAPTPEMTWPLPPPAPVPGSRMTTYHKDAPLPLPDVSEAIHARVVQHLQGGPDPFLLTDEDSPSDEETSPGKRKRRTIKLSKLRTRDTHVVVRIKWPHEVVHSAQNKAPVYEELSLTSFTNEYLGIVAEEKGPLWGW